MTTYRHNIGSRPDVYNNKLTQLSTTIMHSLVLSYTCNNMYDPCNIMCSLTHTHTHAPNIHKAIGAIAVLVVISPE